MKHLTSGSARNQATQTRSEPHPYLVLMTVSVCVMLYSMTVTVVNVALPQLQGALSATPDQVAWVVTLNVVGTAVVTPMTGWLTAKLGQRYLMIGAIIGFAIASFLCATATSLAPMLAYRIAQGGFGAPIVPLAQAIILAAFTGEKRAMAQGIFGMAVVAGMGMAPVLGGYVAEYYDWRAIFLLLVPCSFVALLLTLAFIRQAGKLAGLKLDWTGFVSLAIGIACLQLILDRGERFGWFESTEIILYFGSMGIAFYIFVVHTWTAEHSFFNRDLLKDRNYMVGLALVCVYGMLNFTPITLLPALLQNLKGYPDTLIGLLLATRGTGMIAGFYIAGRMGRIDPRLSMTLGFSLIGLSGFALAFLELNVSPQHIAWAGLLQGFGSGILWVPITTATFWSLSPRLLPDGSAMYHLLRNIGQSVYIAVSFLVVVRSTQMNYADLVSYINPFNELFGYQQIAGAWNTESVRSLAALSSEVSRQARMVAYNNAFLLYGVTCFAVIPVIYLWRKRDPAAE
ncbi:MAG: DHA2 family efflux MFS transporter permease subunit [Gammaproteobacteria bacterium]|nr:DHA2 family efflux MFS transporter permease subunit [Gammaproteobacteria bacterium]